MDGARGRRRALVARSRPRVGCCRDGSGGSTGSSERALDAPSVANSTLANFCRASTGGGLRLRWTWCTCREIATFAFFERWSRLSRVHLDRAERPPTKIRGLTWLY